ncbi:MAG: methyl-accepting chemotaxis protein, partial [Rhizobiales bacterium]|nr:methyl-accepting chemotaxis protein [Hyphomicrobiales bacterium]
MALALFRKRTPAAIDAEPPVSPSVAEATPVTATEAVRDPAKDILGLLELELGAMIRQLEHTATSVA